VVLIENMLQKLKIAQKIVFNRYFYKKRTHVWSG